MILQREFRFIKFMDYIPKSVKQPTPPAPTYELKKDVMGQPVQRGPHFLTITRYDEEGKKTMSKMKVLRLPKSNCKKCYGQGYVGFIEGKVVLCPKCYFTP